MIRGIVKSVAEGFIKLFSSSGRVGEIFTNREYFQHYGFTSRPKEGAEIIIINNGNHYIGIASDDRRYRLTIEDGEVALYTDEGDYVHLKRGNNMKVYCKNKLEADVTNEADINTKKAVLNATDEADVTTKVAKIDASTSVTITSPKVVLNASTEVRILCPYILLGSANGNKYNLLDQRLLAWLSSHTHGGSAPVQSLPVCSTTETYAC